jgi:hypothetical protein
MRDDFQGLLPALSVPTMRVAGAFGTSFFLASLISVIVFDGARGRYWWTAPLLGLVTACFVFSSVFYPAAYGGSGLSWTHQMFAYMGLSVSAAVLALVPYWLLRTFVQPLSGFGGY